MRLCSLLYLALLLRNVASFATTIARRPLNSRIEQIITTRPSGTSQRPRTVTSIALFDAPVPIETSGADKLSLLVQFWNLARPVVRHGGFFCKKRRNRIGGRVGRKRWMDSRAFQGLTQWAFSVCDTDENGEISRDDLYSGILLVHLHLAKYVGIAACQPLNRTQVDELYDIAASKNDGTVGKREFEEIAVVSCAHVASRLVIYWAVLVAMVPFIATKAHLLLYRTIFSPKYTAIFPRAQWMEPISTIAVWFVEHVLTVAALSVLVPSFYGRIDKYFAKHWKRARKPRQRPAWETLREKYIKMVSKDKGVGQVSKSSIVEQTGSFQ